MMADLEDLKQNPEQFMAALSQLAAESPEDAAFLFAKLGKEPEETFTEEVIAQAQQQVQQPQQPQVLPQQQQPQVQAQPQQPLQGGNVMTAGAGATGAGGTAGAASAGAAVPPVPPVGGATGGFDLDALMKGLSFVQASQGEGVFPQGGGANVAGVRAGGLDPAGLANIMALLQSGNQQAPGINLGQLIGG
jgi:hypothetical protein